MVTRRTFLKYSAGGTVLTLFGFDKVAGITTVLADIPGGTLSPAGIPKFQTPLLIPPAMPRAASVLSPSGQAVAYYEISVRQFQQQVLPSGLPKTNVWGYGAVSSLDPKGTLIHNAPSPTIEAKWNEAVRVKWINDLVDTNGKYLPHLLAVDPTLHWANPPGGPDGRDMRPMFEATPLPYTGPVPMVTHVHGAADVGDESDGYSEAWYLPAAKNIPVGYAKNGTWYDFFSNKADQKFGVTWGPGYAIFQYPNDHRATTLWYHDHTLGMTRLNVYAGPAGFYIVRGGPSGDQQVLDSRNKGSPAILPGPAPREGDRSDASYYEIPIALQDRSFNTDGSLFYPDTRAFFDEVDGPYIPETDLSPMWNPEFFGNCLVANGNTWPFLTVEKRRYRFRLLNGCQSRFLILNFGQIPNVKVWAIGNDGGFLPKAVDLTAQTGNRLLMAPAERADVIVDFSNVPVGNYELQNLGPDEPFGGGEPAVDFDVADPTTTGKVLQFRVVPAQTVDTTTPPQFLKLPPIASLSGNAARRRVALMEMMSENFPDSPAAAMLGTVSGNPEKTFAACTPRMWSDGVTENPAPGATEVWEIYNATEDAHPVHLHAIAFEVLDRQDIEVDEATGQVRLLPASKPQPPESWEAGRKDMVIAYPGQVTRIRGQFTHPGQFAWHCHILEHEDNEMMRPLRVGPPQPGQP